MTGRTPSKFSSFALSLLLLLQAPAFGIIMRDDVPLSAYADLAEQTQFQAAGCITGVPFNPVSEGCTATLINARTVVLAAHCLVGESEGCITPNCLVAFPNINFFALGALSTNPTDLAPASMQIPHQLYNGGNSGSNDIALMALSRRIPYIQPAALDTVGGNVGRTITLIGYGNQGTGSVTPPDPPYGQKLAMNNVIDAEALVTGWNQPMLICDFDCPAGNCNTDFTTLGIPSDATPLALEGISADGDSGGPSYVFNNGQWKVIGVVSAGFTSSELYGAIDLYTPVHLFTTWLADNNPLRTVSWTGGSGNWSSASSWSEGVAPNNIENQVQNQALYYETSIQTPVTVTVDTNFTVDVIEINHPYALLFIPLGTAPTAYETHLQAGSLQVNGSFSSSFTLNGGTLFGNGTITAILPNVTQPMAPIPPFPLPPVTNVRGTILPGSQDAVGTLTLMGDYEQQSGATLTIKAGHLSSALLSLPAGSASLNGTLAVGILPDFVFLPGTSTAILTADSISGTFSQVIKQGSPYPYLAPVVTYLSNEVLLSFTPTAETYPTHARHAALRSMNKTNLRIIRQLDKVRIRSQCETCGNKDLFSFSEELLVENLESFQLPTRKLEEVREKARGSSVQHPWSFYVGPTGGFGNLQASIEYKSLGALAGFDYAFSYGGLGFLLDYEHIWNSGKRGSGKSDEDRIRANIYGTAMWPSLPALSLNAMAGGGYEWIRINRPAGLLSDLQTARSSPRGNFFDASFGVEYATEQIHQMQFSPLAYIQYVHAHIDPYKERGAGFFNLKVKSQNPESLSSLLGTRINMRRKWTDYRLKVEWDLIWEHEFFNDTSTLHFSPLFSGGVPTSTPLVHTGRNAFLGGIDLLLTRKETWELELSYDITVNRYFISNTFYLGLGGNF